MRKVLLFAALLTVALSGTMAQRIDEKDYHGQKDVSVVYFIREITPENVLKL